MTTESSIAGLDLAEKIHYFRRRDDTYQTRPLKERTDWPARSPVSAHAWLGSAHFRRPWDLLPCLG